LAAEPPMGSNGIIGTILKFNKVGYFKGRGEEPYPLNKRLLLIGSREGWCYFRNQMPDHTRTVWRNGAGYLPPREELGETEQSQWEIGLNDKRTDPFQHSHLLYFLDPETGEYITFITQSSGGNIAVKELAGRVKAYNQKCPGAYPVVELQIGSWDTKRFSDIARPHFEIVGWCDVNGRPLQELGQVIEAEFVS
jgi:hypothetical protein